mmetsp:Transcript_1955/g.5174  ORF Transcript_1955/g.5174 Transcript_1955/m.5174 type:complete len:99 (-) Transcript_1955:1060-1356(-)
MHRQQAKQHGLQMQKYGANSILGNDFLDPTLKHAVVKCRRAWDSRDRFYKSVQCIAVRCDGLHPIGVKRSQTLQCDAMKWRSILQSHAHIYDQEMLTM